MQAIYSFTSGLPFSTFLFMKLILGFIFLFFTIGAWAQCPRSIDLLVVGDSQSGATWSKSYFGNFLASCLEGDFVVYGRGGTVPGNWLGTGGMDQIETIQRDSLENHLNIGSKDNVPLCKKRISPMLEAHAPKKVLFQFGGNMISLADEVIEIQMDRLMKTVSESHINSENCFFLTPTFEMSVATNRNIPQRNLQAVMRVHDLILKAINGRCQVINGVELMKNSSYFDGRELLRRVLINGLSGCGGAAANDNVHVCGEAAKDMAQRVCDFLKQPHL